MPGRGPLQFQFEEFVRSAVSRICQGLDSEPCRRNHSATGEELSHQLCISLSAVKKAWLSIYGRVAGRLPGLDPAEARASLWFSERGKEKKQRLIACLHEHPEELRPVPRKLLRQVAAKPRASSGRESLLRRSA